jgi:dihydropteroate synthase
MRLDGRMAALCARRGCGVILMHSRGGVGEMASYEQAAYGPDVTRDVMDELGQCATAAREAGIAQDAIVLDPGIGFSKRSAHSIRLLLDLERFAELGYPMMVGVSRKRVVGELSGIAGARERDAATVGLNVVALLRGARLFRVHAPGLNRAALDASFNLVHAHDE